MADAATSINLRRVRGVGPATSLMLLVGLLAGCGSSAHGTSSTASRSGRHGSAPAPHRSVTPRLQALPATSVPIDGPPLQVGFGAVWSASSQGLVRLSVPGGRPQRVLRTAVDD